MFKLSEFSLPVLPSLQVLVVDGAFKSPLWGDLEGLFFIR